MGKRGPKPGAANAGGPRKVINWEDLDVLAGNYNPLSDICAVLDIDQMTLSRACVREKGVTLEVYVEKKRSKTKNRLRGWQIAAAEKGNVTMMIWLGKQLLDQSDKTEKIDKEWASGKKREELIALGREALAVLQAAQNQAGVTMPSPETQAMRSQQMALDHMRARVQVASQRLEECLASADAKVKLTAHGLRLQVDYLTNKLAQLEAGET